MSNNPYKNCSATGTPSVSSVSTPEGNIKCCAYHNLTPQDIAARDLFNKTTATLPDNFNDAITPYAQIARDGCTDNAIGEDKDLEVFKKLYYNPLNSTIIRTSDLLPVYGGKNVSCISTGLVPMVMEYRINNFKKVYARFCGNPSALPDFGESLQYSISRYMNNNNQVCNNSSCNTVYNSYHGQNLETDPIVDKRPVIGTPNIVVLVILGIIIITLIVIAVVYAQESKRTTVGNKRSSRKKN